MWRIIIDYYCWYLRNIKTELGEILSSFMLIFGCNHQKSVCFKIQIWNKIRYISYLCCCVSLVEVLTYLYGSMVDGIAALSGSRAFFVKVLFFVVVVQRFHVHLDCKRKIINYLITRYCNKISNDMQISKSREWTHARRNMD